MKNFKVKKYQSGFLMIEILIAVSIIVISILAIMSVSSKSISISNKSLRTAQATFLLEEGAEVVRILRDNDWVNISNLTPGTDYYLTFSGGTWTLSATPSQVGNFTRTVVISSVNRDSLTSDIASVGVDDPGTKLITINVSWPEGGETISKNLSFYISNIFS